MVNKLCFYNHEKLTYDLRNLLYSGVSNMRKMGLKIALFIILNNNLHKGHIQPIVKPM